MKKMNFKLFVIGLLLVSTSLFGGDTKKNGGAGAQELLIPTGARMIALNGGQLSNVSGIEALYWNPAGVSQMTGNTEILFFNGDQIGDISQKYFAGAFSFGDIGVFAFSIKTFDFGNIPVTTVTNTEGTGETFSPTFITATAGYSNSLTDRIRVGFGINIITEKIVNTSATGISIDAGLQYSNLANISGLDFGVVLKNLGPTMQFAGSDLNLNGTATLGVRGQQIYSVNSAAFELPSQFQIGVTYKYSVDESNGLTFGGVFENSDYSSDSFRGSVEYGFNDMIFLRGSYITLPDETNSDNVLFGPAFGAGLNYDLTYFKIGIDYAYRSTQYFDGLNNISVKIGF